MHAHFSCDDNNDVNKNMFYIGTAGTLVPLAVAAVAVHLIIKMNKR